MIVLLTDFHTSDSLGVVKGVIKSINPKAEIMDFHNFVEPFNVKSAAWILFHDYKYFPRGTIFYCVVDPGVGSARKAVAVKTTNYFFVGPDNGLMFQATAEDGTEKIVQLDTSSASKTFHGRDVFAPAVARLERREDISELGSSMSYLEHLSTTSNNREGDVMLIEHYGNIVTNVKPLKNKSSYEVICNNFKKNLKFHQTYSEAASNELFVIVGSRDTLEISVKQGSAINMIAAKPGDKIIIR